MSVLRELTVAAKKIFWHLPLKCRDTSKRSKRSVVLIQKLYPFSTNGNSASMFVFSIWLHFLPGKAGLMLEEDGQRSQVDFFRLRPSRWTTEIMGNKVPGPFCSILDKVWFVTYSFIQHENAASNPNQSQLNLKDQIQFSKGIFTGFVIQVGICQVPMKNHFQNNNH